MMTDAAYFNAWVVYVLATLVALWALNGWLGRVPPSLRVGLLLMLAALALSPTHPDAETATWAPAIVVAGFGLLSDGIEGMQAALRPLLAGQAIALALALVFALVRLLRADRAGK